MYIRELDGYFYCLVEELNLQKKKNNCVGAQTQKHEAGKAESLILTRNTKFYWYR
jgi:hypothetical protein